MSDSREEASFAEATSGEAMTAAKQRDGSLGVMGKV
jgi:hypothetical protein